MTLDGLLTFLALLVAAYSLASNVSRLRLRLRLFWPVTISAVCFLLAVYYETMAERWAVPCPIWLGSACNYITLNKTFPTSGQVAFIIVILWSLAAYAAFNRKALSARSLQTLSVLAAALLQQQRYAELVELIEPHLDLITRASKRQLLLARLRDRLVALRRPPNAFAVLMYKATDVASALTKVRGRMLMKLSHLARLVPSGERYQAAADDIFRLLFRSPDLTLFIARNRSSFGVKMLGCDVHGVHEFSDEFLMALITNTSSDLYKEIKLNQNESTKDGYWFPSHNKILHFLFSSAENANHLNVGGTLTAWIEDHVRPGEGDKYIHRLNSPAESIGTEKWSDPCFLIIRMFDMMLRSAMVQQVEWHMEVYSLPRFIDQFAEVYDTSATGVDLTAEWPSRLSFIIYEIFDALTNVVAAIEYLPPTSKYFDGSDRLAHANGNLPKSAIIALGMALDDLLKSERFSEKFKAYIFDMVMRQVRDFPPEERFSTFRTLLTQSILHGGLEALTSEQHGANLRHFFSEMDFHVQGQLSEFEGDLATAYP